MPAVRFVFDVISPYAYVAWKLVRDRGMVPVPILFAAVLDALGQKGPAEIPAKRVYAFKDAYRKGARAGAPPLVPPPSHPFNPLCALRVAGLPMPDDARVRLVDALFDAAWGGHGGCETPAQVIAAARRAGLDGEALVARASEPEAKERLRAATAEAIAAGVFGVPSFVTGGEVFWGVDAIPHLDEFLAGRDPVPADAAARWKDLPATARRPRSATS